MSLYNPKDPLTSDDTFHPKVPIAILICRANALMWLRMTKIPNKLIKWLIR